VDHDKLVQLVTAEIMRQLALNPLEKIEKPIIPCKKALAIFTGGTIGLEQSFLELQKIKASSIELSIVLSVAAERMIGSDRIKEQLGSNVNLVTAQSPYPGKLLRDADIVLVPVLTQNTAAKLAYTLSDALPATLIMQALMLGTPVLAAMNAADPQDGWRIKGNMGKCSPALSEALRQNLKRIESYGIELVKVENLATGSQKIMDRIAKKVASSQQSDPQGTTPRGKKNIVDAAVIKVAVGNGLKSIITPRGSIITPLARDIAREYGIELIEEHKKMLEE